MAKIKQVYHLPLRQTQGLVSSIFKKMDLELPVAHYTKLCRRRKGLLVDLPRQRRQKQEPIHFVFDSSKVKVYGEGEWKALLHGRAKRRRWRKLHIGVDEKNREILAALVTDNDTTDGEVLPDLLKQVEEQIVKVTCDKSYDKRNCYEAISLLGAKAVIPPREGARIWRHGNCKGAPHQRDENIRLIRKVGKIRWKEESGYLRWLFKRNIVEATIFRIKTIFSDRVRAKSFEGQAA